MSVLSDMERSNEEWVRLLVEGGKAGSRAHEELRTRLVTGLRRVLASRGVSDDLVEDFAHDAMLRICENIGSFRAESRFVTWALSIAMRVAFDELRRHRWRDVSFETLTSDAGAPAGAFEEATELAQDKALARARVLSTLQSAIESELTDKQRAVLVAELRGMPHGEIARHLQMNRNALYKLSHDARRKVKSMFSQAGIREADVLWAFD